MGYTHYWRIKKNVKESTLKTASNLIQRMLSNTKSKVLGNGMGDKGSSPVVESHAIYFNGIEDNAHETFCFPRSSEFDFRSPYSEPNGDSYFDFCKTALKPYDKYVVAALIIAKSKMGSDIEVSSDGDIDDWKEGIEVAFPYLDHEVRTTIKARINGEFDNPLLEKFGPLSEDTFSDVMAILENK